MKKTLDFLMYASVLIFLVLLLSIIFVEDHEIKSMLVNYVIQASMILILIFKIGTIQVSSSLSNSSKLESVLFALGFFVPIISFRLGGAMGGFDTTAGIISVVILLLIVVMVLKTLMKPKKEPIGT